MTIISNFLSMTVKSYQSFSRENFEQFDKELSITKICVEIRDLSIDPTQVGIDPLGECFLLHMFTFTWNKMSYE